MILYYTYYLKGDGHWFYNRTRPQGYKYTYIVVIFGNRDYILNY